MPAKKSDEEGAREQQRSAQPDAYSAEVAFDKIMEAILGADPEAIRTHKAERRQKRKPRRSSKA